MFRIIPPVDLPPLETFPTAEAADEYFRLNYPDETRYTLQIVRPVVPADLITDQNVIGGMRERASEVKADFPVIESSDDANVARMLEMVGMIRAAVTDWAELRGVEIHGYIVVEEHQITLEA